MGPSYKNRRKRMEKLKKMREHYIIENKNNRKKYKKKRIWGQLSLSIKKKLMFDLNFDHLHLIMNVTIYYALTSFSIHTALYSPPIYIILPILTFVCLFTYLFNICSRVIIVVFPNFFIKVI